jgi:PAS domain S-box-containing protein
MKPQDAAKLEDSTFRGLLEAAPDGILLVDRSGKIVFANTPCARILGYTVAELVGQFVEMIVPEYIRSKHAALRNRYFDSPHSRPMGIGLDLVAARKGGDSIPVEISLSPFKFEGKDGAIAVVRDVTDQRRLQRELKRSNEELEQFAYVASHDLQEPLRMVSGYTQLLKRRHGDKLDAEANEYIDFAVDGVKRMQALITDLLAFSRLNTRGKEFKPVDLNDVAKQAVGNVQASIEESKAKVKIGDLPKVSGDRTQLVQLVQNLLSNALKFRRPDVQPSIELSAKRDGATWLVSVSDNGIGIEPEYREKVFVIFQRLHGRDQYPGTGIGLSICKKIVERHQGRIWIEDREGDGTTFTFSLPAEGST